MRLVLMDVDGTLFDGPSSESAFIFYLMRRRVLGLHQYLSAGLFFSRWIFKFGKHTARKNKAYLAGLPVSEIEARARIFAQDVLKKRLRQGMLRRIHQHRVNGDAVILLTGAPEFLARPIAELVGARGVLGTQLVCINGFFGSAPPLVHPLGEEKLACAKRLCERHDTRLEQCSAYGDSRYDLALMTQVGKAVAVYPDAELRHEAEVNGWEIISAGGEPASTHVKADFYDT